MSGAIEGLLDYLRNSLFPSQRKKCLLFFRKPVYLFCFWTFLYQKAKNRNGRKEVGELFKITIVMKNIFVILALLICSLSTVYAQRKVAPVPTSDNLSTDPASSSKLKGYPPHGYPCLGCAPCPGNPTEFCDIINAAKVQEPLKPHPSALELGYVYGEGRMIPLTTVLEKRDIKRKMGELGAVPNPEGKADGPKYPTSVKCACGTDVWGKDSAACGRICEFLSTL